MFYLRVFFLAIFIGITSIAFAQEPEKKSSYSKMKQESSQVEVGSLLDEANSIKESSPQKALQLVKDALAISILRQDGLAEARCYNVLGQINMNIAEWKLALENFATANTKLSGLKTQSINEKVTALSGMGKANIRLKNYESALRNLQELRGLKIDPVHLIEANLDASEVYYQMENYEEAMASLNKINQYSKFVDPSLEARIENQKSRIYARTNQLDESYKRFQSGQNILRSNTQLEPKKQEAEIRSAKEEISGLLEDQKRYDEKIELLNSSIGYNTDVNNLGEVSIDKVELGKTLIAKGETTAAFRELEEAAFIADTLGDPAKQAEAYLSLAELYNRYGRRGAALDSYQKYSHAVAKNERQNEKTLLDNSQLINTQRDIQELSRYITISKQEEQLAQALVFRQKLVIYGLMLIILIIAVTSYFIYKNALASKTANQLLALKSLRSQMNPHFIFNALNSVNHFVSQNDERTTNRFLSEFSRLMRLVLENSQEDFIPLNKEEEIISLYLKLEHYRFRDKFDYEIMIDGNINKEVVEIPPMLIQPYIENAVWHGLRYKETKGFLSVRINQGSNEIEVVITDDGIGRKRSAELKTENQKKQESTGLRNIRERLGIINKVYKSNYSVHIEDLPANTGTCVTLIVPLKSNVATYA